MTDKNLNNIVFFQQQSVKVFCYFVASNLAVIALCEWKCGSVIFIDSHSFLGFFYFCFCLFYFLVAIHEITFTTLPTHPQIQKIYVYTWLFVLWKLKNTVSIKTMLTTNRAAYLKIPIGSGLPSRWRVRPTLPGSRVTRSACGWRPSHDRNGGVGKKNNTF